MAKEIPKKEPTLADLELVLQECIELAYSARTPRETNTKKPTKRILKKKDVENISGKIIPLSDILKEVKEGKDIRHPRNVTKEMDRKEALMESLDLLRMAIKYLVFDVESTYRENGSLRKLLERKGKK